MWVVRHHLRDASTMADLECQEDIKLQPRVAAACYRFLNRKL
jgi:hypothetical protein